MSNRKTKFRQSSCLTSDNQLNDYKVGIAHSFSCKRYSIQQPHIHDRLAQREVKQSSSLYKPVESGEYILFIIVLIRIFLKNSISLEGCESA